MRELKVIFLIALLIFASSTATLTVSAIGDPGDGDGSGNWGEGGALGDGDNPIVPLGDPITGGPGGPGY